MPVEPPHRIDSVVSAGGESKQRTWILGFGIYRTAVPRARMVYGHRSPS
jgi:hypothetical protein